jgi:branched-chain amino acid transport system permease protein
LHDFLIFTITGLAAGGIYAIAASGLVVTFITSRVFNFAHGAVGMFVAFIYYSMRVLWGWPEWVSLVLCLLVIAPAFGIILDLAIMRRLQRVPVAIRLMVTLALFIALTGLATVIWGTDTQALPPLISNGGFNPISGITITWDQLAIVIIALGVVGGLALYLNRTRSGTTMRAVVDDRNLSEMHGVRVSIVTSMSWALGTTLAALAAILVAPALTLSVEALSILVVSTYAAAVVGRLSSLTMTLVGALGLGLLSSYLTGYLPSTNQVVADLGPAMPFIVLFIALIALKAEPGSRFEKVEIAPDPTVPSLRTTLLIGVGIVVVVSAISPALSPFGSLVLAIGLCYGAILLSLVLLTGMAGQICLAQLTFAGMSAVFLGHLTHYMPWIVAVVVASLIAAVTGALVALPTLRLRGLYLALSTLAFAVMMDSIFFPDSHLISASTGSLPVGAPGILGHALTTSRSQLWLLAVVLAAFMIGIYALRRRPYGHALAAMRDAPVAASALGLNLNRVRITVFSISAGMAGLAGCLYGSVLGQVGPSLYNYQSSLVALLILAIYGLGSVPGAVIGAIFYILLYQLLPLWIHNANVINALQPILIAGGVINLAIHPEGVIAQTMERRRQRSGTKLPKGRVPPIAEHLDQAGIVPTPVGGAH